MKSNSITVRIDSDKYDRLNRLAGSMERSKSFIIEDALSNYLDINEWQISETKEALIEADDPKTKWVSHEEVKKKYLREYE